jgi:hypothetical protein
MTKKSEKRAKKIIDYFKYPRINHMGYEVICCNQCDHGFLTIKELEKHIELIHSDHLTDIGNMINRVDR